MGAAVKIWQNYLTYFFVTIIFKNCQGCTPFSVTNVLSNVDAVLQTAFDEAKKVFPKFDNTTVPNFDSLNEQFIFASNSDEIFLNITEIVNKNGFPLETHELETSDGYILDIFRIPGNGTTVLVVHALLSSAETFVTTGRERALAYTLADQGYDVWLANTRGSMHGRRHVTLSPNCAEFWDFSWDELGRYDLPATIDYILETTGQDTLAYVGYAQGSTSFFVMGSELPEYNDKISVAVAMAPVSYVGHCTSLVFRILAPVADLLYALAQTIGLYELIPRNAITTLITTTACGVPLTTLVCGTPLLLIFGFDNSQLNTTYLPSFLGHFPAGASFKQLIHYLQLINSGEFENFDYGFLKNIEKYGSVSPPDYSVDKITSKLVLIYSDQDVLVATPDRERLVQQLPNVVEQYRVPHAAWMEGDYLIANDLKTLVNDRVVEFIDKYA